MYVNIKPVYLVHQIVDRLDGHAAHLHNDIAEVKESVAIDEAAVDDAGDDDALALHLDGESERLAGVARHSDPVHLVQVDALLFNYSRHGHDVKRNSRRSPIQKSFAPPSPPLPPDIHCRVTFLNYSVNLKKTKTK
jgi:hypothetical protein